jgi:hypothetical protein
MSIIARATFDASRLTFVMILCAVALASSLTYGLDLSPGLF